MLEDHAARGTSDEMDAHTALRARECGACVKATNRALTSLHTHTCHKHAGTHTFTSTEDYIPLCALEFGGHQLLHTNRVVKLFHCSLGQKPTQSGVIHLQNQNPFPSKNSSQRAQCARVRVGFKALFVDTLGWKREVFSKLMSQT